MECPGFPSLGVGVRWETERISQDILLMLNPCIGTLALAAMGGIDLLSFYPNCRTFLPMPDMPLDEDFSRTLSDQELIELILEKGDSHYFSILYQRYFRKVYYQVFAYVKTPEEAEDLSQDIFVKLYDKLSRFQGRSSFSTWLFSLSRNAALDYLRRKGNLPEQGVDESRLEHIPEVEDDELLQFRADRLAIIMSIMPADDKAILIMKYANEWQIDEIAEAMGLGESAVKMRIKRAKNRVKLLYEEKFSQIET